MEHRTERSFMIPNLNWRELELLIAQLRPRVVGLFVDRILVPKREAFIDGYLKGEWLIRLTGKKQECCLLLSIRPKQPYIAWTSGKGPQVSPQATRSPFDLNLTKYIKGAKLLEIESIPRERAAILWFSGENHSYQKVGLVLSLIPATPEAFLISSESATSQDWAILCRSRTIRDESKQLSHYIPPDGSQAPQSPPERPEIIASPDSYYRVIEKELQIEAFHQRLLLAQKNLRQLLKYARDRNKQSTVAWIEAQKEQDWQRLGDLLKGSLGNPPELVESYRSVVDYETNEQVNIKCDPRFTIQEQVEKFYQNARRKQRRIQEAQSRMNRFNESILLYEKTLQEAPPSLDWQALERIEKIAGTFVTKSAAAPEQKKNKKNSYQNWIGKVFTSKDGLAIWVGRNKDENLELTFKHTRGNDIWLHVRGRPGSHVVIPIQPGKSAPLETLLDAAHLTIYYSGGENWGTTEVDYTMKKYVKRIKDSSEASYTNNKTLLIRLDSKRLKRLLDQNV